MQTSKEKQEVKAGDFWNPEKESDSISGTFTRTQHIRDQKGEAVERYVVKNAEGEFILPSHADLTIKMQRVAVGADVDVTLLAKEKRKGGRMYFRYKVLSDSMID